MTTTRIIPSATKLAAHKAEAKVMVQEAKVKAQSVSESTKTRRCPAEDMDRGFHGICRLEIT
jgi:hypothetical protein